MCWVPVSVSFGNDASSPSIRERGILSRYISALVSRLLEFLRFSHSRNCRESTALPPLVQIEAASTTYKPLCWISIPFTRDKRRRAHHRKIFGQRRGAGLRCTVTGVFERFKLKEQWRCFWGLQVERSSFRGLSTPG